jgi:hypothetical protein
VGRVEDLRAELAGIDGEIRAAAMDEDVSGWLKLSMRRDRLPGLISAERTRPLLAEIARVAEQIEALGEERDRVKAEPPPEVPPGERGRLSPEMAKQARIGAITARELELGRRFKELRRRLAAIEEEEEGVRPLT